MQFGCILSPYDSRDYRLKAGATKATLPEEYSCPIKMKVKNQGLVSSCVAHAVSSILEYHAASGTSLSTNFIYGIQKKLFNRSAQGMYLRDACKIAADYGDMLLSDCTGNNEVPKCHTKAEKAFDDAEKLARASNYRILKYFYCANADEIKHAIYNYGPVLASLKWYNNYSVDKNGVLYRSKLGPKGYGYHAVVIYGYTKDGFWCQNSWGSWWGLGGKFFVPNDIKFQEVRGIVDWNGIAELKEPNPEGFLDLLYKGFNAVVNFFIKIFKLN